MTSVSAREQLFWAREFVKLAREQAAGKGVPNHVMAQAMLVQAWMLFTGQSESEAAKSVSGLYAATMKQKSAGMAVPGAAPATGA